MPYPDLSFAEVSSAVVRQVGCFNIFMVNNLALITLYSEEEYVPDMNLSTTVVVIIS